jgi:hypothetical protein
MEKILFNIIVESGVKHHNTKIIRSVNQPLISVRYPKFLLKHTFEIIDI